MKQAWYHCGHCGSLFASGFGLDEDRLCAECGRKPGTGIWSIDEKRPLEREGDLAAFDKKGESLDEYGQRASRKKGRKNIMVRIVVVWFVLISLAVWMASSNARRAKEKDMRLRKVGVNLAKGTMADESVALLSRALPDCHLALAGFLTGGTPEIRNQFVADPIETAGKMAGFYNNNPFPRFEAMDLKRIGQELIRVGDEWMIETHWQGSDGLEFDAVFRREGVIWKLDWEHFARYGDYPWPLFLAGEGHDEAEFRLLARKVASGDEAEQGGSRLRFTLLSPQFGKPAETGMESPEFVVNRRSDEGLLLQAAFDAKESGESVFGSTMQLMEPEGLVRVRVRIKRGEFGGFRSFDLEKVEACHWIGVDEVGFDLKKLSDDLFTTD